MANVSIILSEAAGEVHADPTAFGLNATVWVSIAMLVFLGILVWKKVPAAIGAMLDNKIAEISKQLKEAEQLRLDAESLKAEYEAKLARAAKEAEAMVAKAKEDATALIARRKQMAEDRIAAAEANALAEVRTAAAKAATDAAARLIADKHDAKAAKALIDDAIAAVTKG